MPAHKPTNTTEYLVTLSDEQRRVLERIRALMIAAVPEAIDGFSYGMPLLTLDGKSLMWYAAWVKHYSLYPVGSAILASVGEAASGYETAKGTIRFPASRSLPEALVTKIVTARAIELRERGR